MKLSGNGLREFECFRLDAVKRVLERDGAPVQLTPKAFDVLEHLVAHAGEDVGKHELMQAVWPDTAVEENNLNQAISAARKALGERPNDHRFIVTLPGRGYRFVAPVTCVPDQTGHETGARSSSVRVRALLAAAACLVVIATVWILAGRIGSGRYPVTSRIASVGVVAFHTTPGAGDDHLGSGIAEELVTELANRSGGLSVLSFHGERGDAIRVAREAGVDAVVDGTVERSAGRLRATVRLFDTRSGALIWSGSFDEAPSHVLALREAITARIAAALEAPVPDRTVVGRGRDSTNPSAYEAYLRGRYFWNKRSPDGFARSIAAYKQAIDADPEYALAYAGLADSYVLVGLSEVDAARRVEALDRARDAALRAVALDDTLAEAHTSLAAILEVYEKDRAGAETEYRRAIALNPYYATAHQWYGEFLEADGRFDEAEAMLERAHRIDPLSLVVTVALGENLFFQRRFDEAIGHFQRALELDSEFARARYDLGLALEQKRQYDLAVAEFRRVENADGFNSRAVAALAHAYAKSGRLDDSRRIVMDIDRRADHGTVEPYDMAIVYAGLGDTEQAIEWARRARVRLDGNLLWLAADPRFDPLRSDYRYRQLMGG